MYESELDPYDLDTWQVDPLPEDLDDRIMAAWQVEHSAVNASPAPAQPRRWPWLTAAIAAAATLALWCNREPIAEPDHGRVAGTQNQQTVSIGGRVLVTLDQGTEIAWHLVDETIVVEQTDGRARYRVEPPGLFRLQTPVAAVATTTSSFEVEIDTMTQRSNSIRSRRSMAIGATLVGATGLAFVAVDSGEASVSNPHGRVDVQAGQTAIASDITAPALDSVAHASAPAITAAVPATTKPDAARARRDEVLTKIRAAIAARPEPTPVSAPKGETPAGPALPREYIHERIVEDLVPLARDCYNDLLPKDDQGPGKLVLAFEILGDESVGGIVDSVVPGEGSTLLEPQFVECMSESMMSVVFEPPEGGGVVRVTYPFVFEPEP